MSYMRQGLGEYDRVGNWGWEFDPPPYDFLAPPNSAPQPAPVLRNGNVVMPVPIVLTPSGVGGCGCGCGGSCAKSGGLGLFESGFDYTGWGVAEWGSIAFGGYVLLSLVGDMFSAGRAARRGYRKARAPFERAKRRRQIKREYQQRLSEV